MSSSCNGGGVLSTSPSSTSTSAPSSESAASSSLSPQGTSSSSSTSVSSGSKSPRSPRKKQSNHNRSQSHSNDRNNGSKGRTTSASINGDKNQISELEIAQEVNEIYEEIRKENSSISWVLLKYGSSNGVSRLKNKNKIVVARTGSKPFPDIVKYLTEDEVYYGYFKLTEGHSIFSFLTYIGEKVPILKASKVSIHKYTVSRVFQYYAFDIQANTVEDLLLAYQAKVKQVTLIHKHNKTINLYSTDYSQFPIEVNPVANLNLHSLPTSSSPPPSPIPPLTTTSTASPRKKFFKLKSKSQTVGSASTTPEIKSPRRLLPSIGKFISSSSSSALQSSPTSPKVLTPHITCFELDESSSRSVLLGICTCPSNTVPQKENSRKMINSFRIPGLPNASLLSVFTTTSDTDDDGFIQYYSNTLYYKLLERLANNGEASSSQKQIDMILRVFKKTTKAFHLQHSLSNSKKGIVVLLMFKTRFILATVGTFTTVLVQNKSMQHVGASPEGGNTTIKTSSELSGEFHIIIGSDDVVKPQNTTGDTFQEFVLRLSSSSIDAQSIAQKLVDVAQYSGFNSKATALVVSVNESFSFG